MRYSVVLTVAAAQDFRQLDGSLKAPVAKQLRKLETAPRLGEHLGNRAGLDLTGYYKLYAARNRSVSCTGSSTRKILVRVIAIGKREDLAVYQEALKQLTYTGLIEEQVSAAARFRLNCGSTNSTVR
ncbi:MAG: hypothetical protein MRJ92_11060 [Nitrospira sp.]|nr:hypothetical protein [Nitrospira sp.]